MLNITNCKVYTCTYDFFVAQLLCKDHHCGVSEEDCDILPAANQHQWRDHIWLQVSFWGLKDSLFVWSHWLPWFLELIVDNDLVMSWAKFSSGSVQHEHTSNAIYNTVNCVGKKWVYCMETNLAKWAIYWKSQLYSRGELEPQPGWGLH